MLARVCLGLVLLASSPAWCQVDTSSASATTGPTDDTQLQVPPPVSGQAYSSEFAGSSETNFWSGGFNLSTAYYSNGTGGTNGSGNMSYSLWPTIALNKATPQLHLVLSYSPGFTIYQGTSGDNQANQNLNVNLQYRISPNFTISLQDVFNKTSNIFDQPNPLSASPISGSVPAAGVAVVAPLGNQINNLTSAQLTYQVSATGMLGAGGSFTKLYYPNPEQVSGLYNSQSAGGSLFYSRRLGREILPRRQLPISTDAIVSVQLDWQPDPDPDSFWFPFHLFETNAVGINLRGPAALYGDTTATPSIIILESLADGEHRLAGRANYVGSLLLAHGYWRWRAERCFPFQYGWGLSKLENKQRLEYRSSRELLGQ